MSTDKETLRRVQDGLFHLQKAVQPFVAERMEAKLGKRWIMHASRAQGSSPLDPLDGYGLLKTMLDNWRDVFDDAFAACSDGSEYHTASGAGAGRDPRPVMCPHERCCSIGRSGCSR